MSPYDVRSDKNYWEEYYSKNKDPNHPSPFATFIKSYIDADKEGYFIELGCGNGRDIVYLDSVFPQIHMTGIDQCETEIDYLNTAHATSTLRFMVSDFTKLRNSAHTYDYVYSRFTFHSINLKEEMRTIKWIQNNLKKGGLFFLEARSIKGDVSSLGSCVGENEYLSDHYRRLMSLNETKENLQKSNLSVIYAVESRGLAVYKNEDPVVVRIIAKKT